jgi:hypothetical protein
VRSAEREETNDLLAQLPAMFKELVVISPPAQPIPFEESVRRVADELQVVCDEARNRIARYSRHCACR